MSESSTSHSRQRPRRLAVVTGASSGIGAATAAALAEADFDLILGARRLDRLQSIADPLGASAVRLDVTDSDSLESFVATCPERVDLLVNNAGGALGLDPVEKVDTKKWRTMWETNVLAVARLSSALLPALRASGNGHIINIGSIAGFEVYPGGGGYTAAKHAIRAVTQTLRLELLGEPVRITEINPGLVATEFSLVRFAGDQERAEAVYQGMTPLVGADVADCVAWAATRPAHVNIDEIVVRPRDQATATRVHRTSG